MIIIVIIAEEWNVGTPKKKGVGKRNHDAAATGASDTLPKIAAKAVPSTIPNRIEMALVKPFANKLTRTIIAIVNVPIARFAGLPNDLAATSPPPKF